jgi:hypothetical protein
LRRGLLLLLALSATARAQHAGADLDCGDCHTAGGWAVSGGRGFDHARTGFPLSGAHDGLACGACHTPSRPITRACAGCHEDPHEARLGVACDVCHGPATFRETRARERHARTRLPLSGMHALLDCTACHVRGAGQTWSDVPADCYACHAADYRRDGIHPVHDGRSGNPPFSRACGTCHRPIAWSPAVITPRLLTAALRDGERRAHERAFPIGVGKHRGLACADCHLGPAETRVVACAGCHATARHRGGGRPLEGTCLGCHPRGTR